MTRSARRCLSLTSLAALVLLGGLQGRGSAESVIADVSKERAKELGITVRSLPRPDDVRVQVDFKAEGAMKEFRYADLLLTQGGKRLVASSLMPRKPTPQSTPDHVRLEFYVDPAVLPNASVTVFVYPEPHGGIGYRLKMKDLLAPAAP